MLIGEGGELEKAGVGVLAWMQQLWVTLTDVAGGVLSSTMAKSISGAALERAGSVPEVVWNALWWLFRARARV